MILFRKWAKHNVKLYIYGVNQFKNEKRHKKWNQKGKQNIFCLFCSIFVKCLIFWPLEQKNIMATPCF